MGEGNPRRGLEQKIAISDIFSILSIIFRLSSKPSNAVSRQQLLWPHSLSWTFVTTLDVGTLCVSSCIGKVMFECLYGNASVGANTLASSMMQAWLVVSCGVADLDVCLLSRVRCGNRGETKGAKTTHRRLCNRGISQHRAANHSTCFQTTKKEYILTSPSPRGLSFRMSCKESGHI